MNPPSTAATTKPIQSLESHTDQRLLPLCAAQATPDVSLPPLIQLALKVKAASKCIQKGQQKVYHVPLDLVMHDRAKGVAKYKYGEPCRDTHEYVVLVVGATGAGKTTFVNGVANYIFGVQWNDNFRFKLITDEGSGSQAEYIIAYTIHKQNASPFPHTLTIVDTPGFGDTTVLERDKRLVAQIKHFFSIPGGNGIAHIHGIGFVTHASIARLTPTQRYIFDSILAILGKDIESNILLITTFADGKKPPVLDAVKDAKIEYCKFFKFNNSAIFTDEASTDSEGEDRSFGKMFWEMSMASFKSFFTQLAQMEARSPVLTKKVLEEQEELETIVQSLPQQIQSLLSKINLLKQEERIIEQHEADIKANKDFTFTVNEPHTRTVNIAGTGRYVTNCSKCNFTCHLDCRIPDDDNKRYCVAMKKTENCAVCPGKCFWRSHHNNDHYFVVEEVPVEKTYNEIKQRYMEALNGKTTKENVVNMVRSEIVARYRDVSVMIRKAQQILKRLDEIALRPNPLSQVTYIDLMIESEQRQGKQGFMERVKVLTDVRRQAELLSTVKDDKIFEDEILKMAQQYVEAESGKKINKSWVLRFSTVWNTFRIS